MISSKEINDFLSFARFGHSSSIFLTLKIKALVTVVLS